MTLYCAFLKTYEPFQPEKHMRHDVQMLTFTLQQREGEVALLRMEVAQNSKCNTSIMESIADKGCFCCISYQKNSHSTPVCVFQGNLCHIPTQCTPKSWMLEFRGHVRDDCLKNIHAAQTHHDAHYPYFQEIMDENPLTQKLHDTCALYEYVRERCDVAYVDYIKGQTTLTFPNVFQDSVSIRFNEIPHHNIHVSVRACWTQQDQGEVNIAPALEAAFPERIMNTLTPNHFEKTFPHAGTCLRGHENLEDILNEDPHSLFQNLNISYTLSPLKTAYYVVESSLTRIPAPQTGVLDVYPESTAPFLIQDQGKTQTVSWPRTWFRATLYVAWRYKQKRQEIIHIPLVNAHTSFTGRPVKTIQLTVHPDVINSIQPKDRGSLSSFFKTDVGARALQHAIRYARCFFKASSRCVDVVFKVPFEDALHIGTHMSVDISSILNAHTDTQTTAVPLFGKVTEYQLIKQGIEGYARIHCALVMDGTWDDQHHRDEDPNALLNHIQSIQDGIEPKGIVDTRILHTPAIVDHIHVLNDGQTQSEKLVTFMHEGVDTSKKENAQHARSEHDLKTFLTQHPTRFSIQLKPFENVPMRLETFTSMPLSCPAFNAQDVRHQNGQCVLSWKEMRYAL